MTAGTKQLRAPRGTDYRVATKAHAPRVEHLFVRPWRHDARSMLFRFSVIEHDQACPWLIRSTRTGLSLEAENA